MKRFFLLYMMLLTALIISCRKEDNNITTPQSGVTPVMARDTVYDIMNEWYYWADQMPAVTKNNYTDPASILEAMRYKQLDRWSFVADYNEFEAEMNGEFVGHGFRIGLDDSLRARIAMIYTGSPLYASGVRRGWIVKSINGADIVPLLLSPDPAAYSSVIGPANEGVTNTFVFIRPDGQNQTISSTKSKFTTNTVLLSDTLHIGNEVAGHLVFESFIKPSSQELDQAFAFFKANNVQDLILDLRYNPGGYLDIADQLASYIGGNALAGTTFAKLQFNSQKRARDTALTFEPTSYPLSLTRLVVITTRNTASASESVMNSLTPHMQVVSVGDTTNGKPTGMYGWPIGKKYWFWPVTFKLVNSLDQGDYFAGIAPDKIAPDDITHDFDSRDEACLKEAIAYLQTGAFRTAKSFEAFKKYPRFSEKPSWMNNTFVRNK